MTTFSYLMVLVSVVVGLGLAHILEGIARLVSQPETHRFYWIHGVWTVFVFQYLILFWWFEFQLAGVETWQFEHFTLIILYSVMLYGLVVLLYPRTADFDGDYRSFYYQRCAWFMGALVVTNVIDVFDTLAKGQGHFEELGWNYLINSIVVTALALACMRWKAPWLHGATAVIALGWQIQITLSYYGTIS